MELEQCHIIKFLHLKSLNLQQIAAEPSSAYGQDADARPSIKDCLRQIKLARPDLQTPHLGGQPPLDDVDFEMLSLLRKFPFPSMRTITGSLTIPASTVYSHLMEKIGLKTFLLRWVPDALTGELQQK
jgi:hypothetical protein